MMHRNPDLLPPQDHSVDNDAASIVAAREVVENIDGLTAIQAPKLMDSDNFADFVHAFPASTASGLPVLTAPTAVCPTTIPDSLWTRRPSVWA